MLLNIIGYIAAVGTMSSFIPQAIKVIKTKDTKGISLYMYIIFLTGTIMWSIYGIFKVDIAIMVSNSITVIFALIILIFKIVNVSRGEKP